MAALFRMAVIAAILYLARFALAHPESSDSADSQQESWSNSEGPNEEEYINSGASMDSDGSSEKEFLRSGVPMGSEGSREEAVISSGVALDSYGSSEKVLIKSGVPLRGRTIHHTAWSEEDKVLESNENPPQQQIENGGDKSYDSWSLRKALNYILSFVYDVEDGGIVSNIVPNSPENPPKDKLKLQKSEFDELMAVSQTHANPNGHVGNLSVYNRNRDNLLHTTPNNVITYFEKQDVEWSEGGDGNLYSENRHDDYDFEDNSNELLNDDIDSQYEDGFYDEPDDESAIDQGQRGKLKDMESKIFEQPESDIQKTSRNEHLYEVIENEPAFETEHLHQKSSESEEVNGNTHKKKKEDDIHQLNEGTLDDQNSNTKIQEPRKEIKVAKIPTHHSEKPAVKNRSIIKENSSINTNQESEGNGGEIISVGKNKSSSGTKMIQPKKQDSQIMSSETSTSSSKLQNKEPFEISEDNVADENSATSEANIITESKISNEILKKNSSSPRNVSKDLQNDDNGGASSAKNSSEKTIIEGKPSTLNTTDQKPSQIKEEIVIKKINVPGSDTKGYSLPKDEKKIINTEPSTLVPQKLLQQKEQSPDSDNHARKEKSEIHDANNSHGGKQAYIPQLATTEQQYDKIPHGAPYDTRTIPENSIVYAEQKVYQQKIEGENETVHLPEKKPPKVLSMQSNLNKDVKSLKNPLRENGTKNSKPNMMMLSDKYNDLEPDEIVGSYNYLLDSFEFIRVDEDDKNKLKKKLDNSVHVLKNEKDGAPQEKIPPILLEPSTPIKHQSEHELNDESHEVFGTILEYLYKNSNNSFLLSLKENNSSES